MSNITKLTAMIIVCAFFGVITSVSASEMFLKPREPVAVPHSEQVVRLINGTFAKSENSINRDRMANVIIVGNGRLTNPPLTAWYDDENSSCLNYKTEDAGTYVIGVSTRPRVITMSQEQFIAYLKHEGVLDTLKEFESGNTPTEVRERYSKHTRAIVQVGDKKTSDYSRQFDYPVEIIPDQNPYDLRFGDELSFRVLYKGEPVENQLVRASYEGFHGHDASGAHINSYNLRTDKDGRASLLLSNKALWYISLIHMQKVNEAEVDYESNWATVTFLAD